MTPRELADFILRLGSDEPSVQAAVKTYQLSVHLTADGKYGPLTRASLVAAGIPDAPAPFYKPAAPTVDSPGAVSKEQAVLDAAAALDAAWLEHGFGPLGDAMRAMLLGHAFGESQFGRHIPGFKDTLRGTNNWGSVQATQKWMQAHGGTDFFGAAAHLDHRGDGTPYVGYYRIYPNQYEAAKGWLATVLYSPAEFAASMAQGPSAYAQYLRSHGYYEAPVERYTTMLTNGQADMWRTLQAARAHGLKPAEPKQAGFGEAPVAPLIERLHTPKGEYSPGAWGTVSMEQFAATKADGEGVRWFGKPLPAVAPPTEAASPAASVTPAAAGAAGTPTAAAASTPPAAGSPSPSPAASPGAAPAATTAASPVAAGSPSGSPAAGPSPSPTPNGAGSGGGAGPGAASNGSAIVVRHTHGLAPFVAVGAAVGLAALLTGWLMHRTSVQAVR
jgi:hypothetical protein